MMGHSTRRLDEIDSLRGLAAMAVLFGHIAGNLANPYADGMTIKSAWVEFLLARTPLAFMWAGHEAVILFFVLSGFVLSFPWLRGQPVNYPAFAMKRACRIWIPYMAALAFALCVRVMAPPASLTLYHSGEVSAGRLIAISSLVGYFDPGTVNPVFWSLVHEMRVSLIFPLLMIAVRGRTWRNILAVALALSIISGLCRKLIHPALDEDIWSTLHYTAFFLIGYLLAENRERIQRAKVGPRSLILGLCFYTYAWWCLPAVKVLHIPHVDDWLIAVGSAILIVCALSFAGFTRLLRTSPLVWLGRVSFSLYLFHLPIMIALLYGLRGIVHPVWVVVISVPVSLFAAEAGYRWVELPAIRMGRIISERFMGWPKSLIATNL